MLELSNAGSRRARVLIEAVDEHEITIREFAAAAESATIFGRIAPQQKEQLVAALRQRGHYVAMIGDGVNDVLALKQANLGVGMQGGSQAARGVADLVLMNNSFAALPPAVAEGQRIVTPSPALLVRALEPSAQKLPLRRLCFHDGTVEPRGAFAHHVQQLLTIQLVGTADERDSCGIGHGINLRVPTVSENPSSMPAAPTARLPRVLLRRTP